MARVSLLISIFACVGFQSYRLGAKAPTNENSLYFVNLSRYPVERQLELLEKRLRLGLNKDLFNNTPELMEHFLVLHDNSYEGFRKLMSLIQESEGPNPLAAIRTWTLMVLEHQSLKGLLLLLQDLNLESKWRDQVYRQTQQWLENLGSESLLKINTDIKAWVHHLSLSRDWREQALLGALALGDHKSVEHLIDLKSKDPKKLSLEAQEALFVVKMEARGSLTGKDWAHWAELPLLSSRIYRWHYQRNSMSSLSDKDKEAWKSLVQEVMGLEENKKELALLLKLWPVPWGIQPDQSFVDHVAERLSQWSGSRGHYFLGAHLFRLCERLSLKNSETLEIMRAQYRRRFPDGVFTQVMDGDRLPIEAPSPPLIL